MATIKIPYLIVKKRRGHNLYYWQPKKTYAPHFMHISLGKDEIIAVEKAKRYNAELKKWRQSGIDPNKVREGSVSWLIEEFLKSGWFNNLAPRTQKDYRYQLNIFKKFGTFTANKIIRQVVKSHYNDLAKTSLHNANAQMRVIKVLYSFAIDESIGDITDNPAKGIRLIGTKARQQVWTREETARYAQRAIEMGRKSIAFAVIIAENTAQREADILRMKRSQYNGKTVIIRQNKTGALVEVKCTRELKKWIDSTEGEYLVINEETGKPYGGDNFRHWFAKIKEGLGLDDKLFMDLRRTTIVRLAEAKCELPEITSVSGHDIETCKKIIEVYLPRNATMASNAIDKLEAHNDEMSEQKTELRKRRSE